MPDGLRERMSFKNYLILQEMNLKPGFYQLLAKGLSTGILSPQEIASALPKKLKGDRVLQQEILDWLLSCLKQLEIKIVSEELKSQLLKVKEMIDGSIEISIPLTPEEREAQRILGYKMFSLFKALREVQDEEEKMKLRNQIIVQNLGLPGKVLFRYLDLIKDPAINRDDLFQEGTLGLLSATDHFDYLKGYRFATYAWWWMNQHMKLLVANSGIVRIPVNELTELRQFNQTQTKLEDLLERKPTEKELLKELKWSSEKLRAVLDAKRFTRELLSLDEPRSDKEEDLLLAETISLEDLSEEIGSSDLRSGQQIEKEIYQFQLQKRMSQVLSESNLLDAERYCLEEYFEGERTLDEIGETLGITRERVRQRIEEALKKLRTPHTWEKLKDFISDTDKPRLIIDKELSVEAKKRIRECLLRGISYFPELPSEERVCLERYFSQRNNGRGQSLLEIARDLSLKPNQVSRLIQQGLKRLPEPIWQKIAMFSGVKTNPKIPQWREKKLSQPRLSQPRKERLLSYRFLECLEYLEKLGIEALTPPELENQVRLFFGIPSEFSWQQTVTDRELFELKASRRLLTWLLYEKKNLPLQEVAQILNISPNLVYEDCRMMRRFLRGIERKKLIEALHSRKGKMELEEAIVNKFGWYLDYLKTLRLHYLSPEKLIEVIAQFFGFSKEELFQKKISQAASILRQIIAYTLWNLKGLTYSRIAQIFNLPRSEVRQACDDILLLVEKEEKYGQTKRKKGEGRASSFKPSRKSSRYKF